MKVFWLGWYSNPSTWGLPGHHKNVAHRINYPGLIRVHRDPGSYRGLTQVLCICVMSKWFGVLLVGYHSGSGGYLWLFYLPVEPHSSNWIVSSSFDVMVSAWSYNCLLFLDLFSLGGLLLFEVRQDGVDLEEMGGRGKTEKMGKENCIWNVIYERRIIF